MSLSHLLRYILEDRQTSTVGEEFTFLRHYCELQKLRFQERLNIRMECDASVKNWIIPRLLLQPLAENAILHGIEPADRPCRLTMTARPVHRDSETVLEIVIADDGIGMDGKAPGKSGGIGLANVRDRLSLSYGDRALLRMESSAERGTSVWIEISGKDVSQPDEHSRRR